MTRFSTLPLLALFIGLTLVTSSNAKSSNFLESLPHRFLQVRAHKNATISAAVSIANDAVGTPTPLTPSSAAEDGSDTNSGDNADTSTSSNNSTDPGSGTGTIIIAGTSSNTSGSVGTDADADSDTGAGDDDTLGTSSDDDTSGTSDLSSDDDMSESDSSATSGDDTAASNNTSSNGSNDTAAGSSTDATGFTIPSSLWGQCRQQVPCDANPSITVPFTAAGCASVAAAYNDSTTEELGPYVAIGPYLVPDETSCQVVVSNLGNGQINFARPDLMQAVVNLSSTCLGSNPSYTAVICDLDYAAGSVHISITAVGQTDYAPVAGNATAPEGAAGSSAAGSSSTSIASTPTAVTDSGDTSDDENTPSPSASSSAGGNDDEDTSSPSASSSAGDDDDEDTPSPSASTGA
ncbi:MAG: hypothetical protein CYPHOPRED_005817 [Cyphobasidiales sp. Tagirdzhanova-0007]|nr:MAG: hypothetical protein CYPHOPRED_005817 [Cyphobasidiales sp. Tagirdzhanova-0007]